MPDCSYGTHPWAIFRPSLPFVPFSPRTALGKFGSAQQLAVLTSRHPQPRMAVPDWLFRRLLHRFWSGWNPALVIVQPNTVVRWQQVVFIPYWRWISRNKARLGRKPTNKKLRELIFRMVAENPTWGAPRIHGELKVLGFDISERTVLRWMRKAPRDPEPARRWGHISR
jgi:putative transposase